MIQNISENMTLSILRSIYLIYICRNYSCFIQKQKAHKDNKKKIA